MELTITRVHRIMGNLLGPEAITLQNHVHRVEEYENVIGAVISSDGVFYYDPAWWEENIDMPEKARHVIMSEILKRVLGAERRRHDWPARVAVGAVINAFLFQKYNFHQLPRAMYSAINPPECLLRPGSRGLPKRIQHLYKGIWNRTPRFTSFANVEKAIRILFLDTSLVPGEINPEHMDVCGYLHGEVTDGNIEVMSGVIDTSPPEDLVEQLSRGLIQQCGFDPNDNDYVIKKLASAKTLESQLIEEFALDKIQSEARKYLKTEETVMTPLPLHLSRSDITLLARGHTPLYFHKPFEEETGKAGLAVYLDVSGSFYPFIPYLVGMLEGLDDLVQNIYQFSNFVHETSMKELKDKAGLRIHTSGGTDFDCVVRHAIDNEFKKILIFTDGWADVGNEQLREEASSAVEKCAVIIASSVPGTAFDRSRSKYQVDSFLGKTWMGKTYKFCMDLSQALK